MAWNVMKNKEMYVYISSCKNSVKESRLLTSAGTLHHGPGMIVTAGQPRSQLTQLHFRKLGVSWNKIFYSTFMSHKALDERVGKDYFQDFLKV